MGRPRKKPITEKVVKEETKAVKPAEVKKPTIQKAVKDYSFKVVKLIRNPMKISLSIVLNDFKPYALTKVQIDNDIFMEHIEKLISLKKIKRV